MTPTERDAVIAAINWIGETCAAYEWKLPKCHRQLTSVMAAPADQSDAGRDGVIEAVAKAMYKARHDGLANCYPWDDTDLDHDHPDCRPALYRDAKAAILAIRALASAPSETVGRGEDERQCTCHPDDNPPRPCSRKYALSECRRAAGFLPTADRDAIRAALELGVKLTIVLEDGGYNYADDRRQITAALALIGEGR